MNANKISSSPPPTANFGNLTRLQALSRAHYPINGDQKMDPATFGPPSLSDRLFHSLTRFTHSSFIYSV